MPVLLEIIENCNWFSVACRRLARSCINARNNNYGHVSELEIDQDNYYLDNLESILKGIETIEVVTKGTPCTMSRISVERALEHQFS